MGAGYLLNIHMKNKFFAGIITGFLNWPIYAIAFGLIVYVVDIDVF